MRKLYASAAALAFLLAAASATPVLAQDTGRGSADQPMPMKGHDKAAGSGPMTKHAGKMATGADAEFHHGMATMQHEMSNMKMTGNPDKDFVMMMIPHHSGAIDMAKVELKYGKDPELRKLAQDIVDAQEKEISFMQDWQSKQPK